MAGTGKSLKVHVYQDSDGEFRVFPPVVVLTGRAAANTDDLTVVNHTGEDLIWNVPAGPFDPANSHAETVGKGGGKSAAPQNARQADVATPYVIFMLQSGKKATGNSDPVIIVET
jgi:hypothetical protein